MPEFNPRALWEKLMLDEFQAGLAWLTILRKRDAFRAAVAGFDAEQVAQFGEQTLALLLTDAGIVPSRAKIAATIGNARAYRAMRDAGEDFADFAWDFVDVAQIIGNGEKALSRSPASEALSAAFKRRGFKFAGPVIVYAWMEACGLVDDDEAHCLRRHSS